MEFWVNGERIEMGLCLLDRFPSGKVVIKLHETRCEVNGIEGDIELPIRHSQNCPAEEFTRSLGNQMTVPRDIEIKLCLLVRRRNEILLTRTTDHVSFFPKKWVFPEDHIIPHESIDQTADRILHEQFRVDARCHVNPLMLYEEIIPYKLEWGLPRRQRLLIFAECNLLNDVEFDQINKNILDYACWATRELLFEDHRNSVKVIGDNSIKVDRSQLVSVAPNNIGEGIAEGHLVALREYFNKP